MNTTKNLQKPVTYSEFWKQIIAENELWFDEPTMRFFNSRISWNTLTRCAYSERWVFVSSEKSPFKNERRYSIRIYTPNADMDYVGEFDMFKTRAEAMKALTRWAGAN